MRGRLNLLRILAYESNVYPFKAISEWYGAFLKAIEMGMGSWLDSPYVLGQAILAKYKPVTKESPTKRQGVSGGNLDSKQKPMVWFCAGFNRGKCSKSSPHENKVRGKSVQVEHICAACWVGSSKKNVHAECSSACPLFSGSDWLSVKSAIPETELKEGLGGMFVGDRTFCDHSQIDLSANLFVPVNKLGRGCSGGSHGEWSLPYSAFW